MKSKRLLLLLLLALVAPWAANAQKALPYSYGFENNDLDAEGWTVQKSSDYTGISTQAAYSGSYGFLFNYTEQNAYLVSPVLTGTENGVTVGFYYKEAADYYGDEQFYFGYTTDETVTDPSSFTYGSLTTASLEWQLYEETLPAGTKKIAIKYVYNDALYLYLDDFSFEAPSSCTKPVSLAGTANGQEATLTWTGDASSFDVAYSLDATANPDDNIVANVSTTSYTMDGLELDKDHYFWVRSNCGSEMSAWVGPRSIHIGYCVPAPTSVDGNGISNVTFGMGDYMVNNDTPKATYADFSSMIGAAQVGVESTIAITLETGFTYNTYVWVDFDNSLSFDADEVICYGESSSANPTTLTLSFVVPSTQALGDFRMRIGSADSGLGSDPETANPCYTGAYGCFQDYTLRLLEAPTCLTPTNLVVNYTGGTSATLTWNENGTATSWDIQYSTDPEFNDIMTGQADGEPTYTLTGLALATTYYVRVSAWCEEVGAPSMFSNPVNFTTDACMPENMCELTITLTDAYGDGGGNIQVVDVLTNVVLGSFTNSGVSTTYTLAVCDGRELNFVYASTDNWSYENGWVITDINNEIISEHVGCSSSGSCDAPTNGVIANYTMSCTVTTCRRPTDLAVSEVGPHSAVLSWTENGEATAWVVEVIDMDGGQTTYWDANANPFTIPGLAPETNYKVRVRPICSDFDDKWSESLTFPTEVACPNPTDLSVTPNPFSADMTWAGFAESYNIEWAESPATREGGLWLQYDNGTHYTNIGNTTSSVRTWGVMYPAAMLEGNNTLTKVAVQENANYYTCESYTINIYNGADQPETLIGTEIVVPTGETGMHEITLSTPITIDPLQNLWITLSVEGTYVMAACQNTERNNQWWDNNNDGVWTCMADDNSSLAGYGWMIRGYVEGYDASAWDWNQATSNTASYTINGLEPETTYAVRVQANCGDDGVSNWIWAVFTTPSACDAPIELEATDITENAATLNWVGYQDSYNLQYREAMKYIPVWEDDFENGIGEEWTIVAGEEATYPSSGIWYTINPISGLSFEAHSGSYCASSWSWNSSAYDADNWLITPQLDLQGVLKYYVRTSTGYPDSYEVLLSLTDTETTSFDVTLKAMAPAPNNGEWNEVVIDLSDYVGRQGYIAIHHVDYDMNYLCIDDLGIYTVEEAGEWIPVTTNEPTYALTGLNSNTDYEWQVQGVNASCEGGLTEWTEIATFTTLAPTSFTQTLELTEGWNWVSLSIEAGDPVELLQMLEAALGDNAVQIQSFDDNTEFDGEEWFGGLDDIGISNAQMYMIEVVNDCTVELQGTPADPADYEIYIEPEQWTWIGYPCTVEQDIAAALADFEPEEGDQIQAGNIMTEFDGEEWFGDFETLVPGQGYMYYSNYYETKVLVIRASAKTRRVIANAGPIQAKKMRTTDVDVNL